MKMMARTSRRRGGRFGPYGDGGRHHRFCPEDWRRTEDSTALTARRTCRCSRRRRCVAQMPVMGVFNNLIMFDQHKPQISLQTIVPDLATSWSWNEEGTELTFTLRQGVKWHDGQPFTAADVKCTWDLLLDKRSEKLRLNPRKTGYDNLAAVDRQRRLRGHLSPEAAAAGFSDAARRWFLSDLSVPRIAGADAAAPDRHRPLQIRRISSPTKTSR